MYKRRSLNKLTLLEFKRIYYFFLFGKLPYKDQFYFRNCFSLIPLYRGVSLFVFNGRYWFRFKVTSWNSGFSVRSFMWTKRLAVFKKKTLKKKK